MLVKEGNTGIKLAATLRTEVTVQPDPSKGRVVMESGPIYFTPTANKDSVKKPILGKDDAPSNNSNASTDESVAEVSPSFSDALPEWLLWGGRPVSIDNRDDENSIMINQDGDRIDVHQDALVAEEKVSRDSVKSSVQARFRIELQWKSFKISNLSEKEKSGVSSILARANIMRKSFSLFSKADPESSTSDFKPDNDLEFDLNELSGLSDGGDSSISADRNAPMMPENTDSAVQEKETPQGEKEEDGVVSLPVTAVVKVWVDVNLPVREDLSSALSFPPIKLLLNQAGALTTKALLRTIAPTLGKLLVKDHDNRRKVNGGTSSSKVEDIQTSFKKQENIYDDLTADIEIR